MTPDRTVTRSSSTKSDEDQVHTPSTVSPQEGQRSRSRVRSHSRSHSGSSISPQVSRATSPAPPTRCRSAAPAGADVTPEDHRLPTVLSGRSTTFTITPAVSQAPAASATTTPAVGDPMEGPLSTGSGINGVSQRLFDTDASVSTSQISPGQGQGGASPSEGQVSSKVAPAEKGAAAGDLLESALYRASMGVVASVGNAFAGIKDLLQSASKPTVEVPVNRGLTNATHNAQGVNAH